MRTMLRTSTTVGLAAGGMMMASVEADAILLNDGPSFEIGHGTSTSWQEAIQNGNVQAASGELTEAARQFYSTQAQAFDLVESQVFAADDPIADANGTTREALVMQWDTDAGPVDGLAIGAWDFVYDVDPDLNGTKIIVTILPPPGVWDLSLELIDSDGDSAGWFLSMPATVVWQELAVHPDDESAQGFDFFFQEDDFDLDQVVAIRLDEAALTGADLVFPPPGVTLPGWNAWGSLRVVVPEPASLALFGLGVAGLALMRRRAD